MQNHSKEFHSHALQLNAEFSGDTGTSSSLILHSEQSFPQPKDSLNFTNGQDFLVEAL